MKAIMNCRMTFFIFLLTVSLQGCFWPFNGPGKSDGDLTSVSVEILNGTAFKREGAIAFIPFVAGPDAEAGKEIDRLALVIVKSTADALAYSPSTLRVATEEDLSGAKYVLDGRIEEFIPPSGFAWSRKKGMLRIKGELRRQDTGEVMVLIAGQKFFGIESLAEQSASEIGQEIAEGLLK